MKAKISIASEGRCGHIEYREGEHYLQCYWEFGGGDTIAIISLPAPETWDQRYPWAQGRREEVLQALVNEARRQKAPRARIEWDAARHCAYFKT